MRVLKKLLEIPPFYIYDHAAAGGRRAAPFSNIRNIFLIAGVRPGAYYHPGVARGVFVGFRDEGPHSIVHERGDLDIAKPLPSEGIVQQLHDISPFHAAGAETIRPFEELAGGYA